MRRRAQLAAGLTAALAAACAAIDLPPVDARVRAAAPDAPLAQLERGRHLLATACTECHGAIQPTAIGMRAWDDALPDMLEKAGLDAAAGGAIRAYVVAARAAATRAAGDAAR